MLSINSTLINGRYGFSANSLGFGQIIYDNLLGVQTPTNQTVQQLFSSSAIPVLPSPAFRGLGLPAAAWTSFSNLMEVVTRGQFDCSTEMQNGVNYGFCISYTSCGNFQNIWQYAF
jgi:hypothetical protein